MKCSNCNEGELRVRNSKYLNNGVFIRTRKCNECGYITRTAEIPYDLYEGTYAFLKIVNKMSRT